MIKFSIETDKGFYIGVDLKTGKPAYGSQEEAVRVDSYEMLQGMRDSIILAEGKQNVNKFETHRCVTEVLDDIPEDPEAHEAWLRVMKHGAELVEMAEAYGWDD